MPKKEEDSKNNSENVRKSILTKSIKRTIKTEDYESLVIEESITEEIYWTTLEERQNKIMTWNKLLIGGFKLLHDQVMETCGFPERKAYIKNKLGSYGVDTNTPALSESGHEASVDEVPPVNVDDLDTI